MGIGSWLRRSTPQEPAAPQEWTIGQTPVPGGGMAEVMRQLTAGLTNAPVYMDRAAMMRIPAVKRGRGVICNTIASFPLRTWQQTPAGPRQVELSPAIRQPEPWRARVTTLTWTLDDLIFNPYAWWQVTARDTAGYPLAFQRIEPWRVTYETQDATGRPIRARAFLDGQEVTDGSLKRFDGPDEGLLALGSSLVTAYKLEQAAQWYANTDIPMIILKYIGNGVFGPDQAKAIRDAWTQARAESGVAVLNANMDAQIPQTDPDALQLIESRQYSAVEVSRLLGLRPRYVNASSGDSMTYSNLASERLDLAADLQPYISAIEQRLSMDDITPPGQTVRFDLDAWLNPEPTERAAYWSTLVGAQIATPQQAAAAEGIAGALTLPGDTR